MPAYFEPTAGGLQPAPMARSPWADDMLHGRLLAGLAARAIEGGDSVAGYHVARLTVDMFKSPPMTPIRASTSVARAGGRVRAVDVAMHCGETQVARASAVLLRTGEARPTGAWQPPVWTVPGPDDVDLSVLQGGGPGGGWDVRPVNPGGFWSAARKQVWTRDTWELVAGEPMSPLVRAALAADLPNPMANAGSGGLGYINADLTMTTVRLPTSDWIGLDVSSHLDANGLAIGACTMYDLDGAFGWSSVCAVANAALAQ